jgi:hypothetical protein
MAYEHYTSLTREWTSTGLAKWAQRNEHRQDLTSNPTQESSLNKQSNTHMPELNNTCATLASNPNVVNPASWPTMTRVTNLQQLTYWLTCLHINQTSTDAISTHVNTCTNNLALNSRYGTKHR